METEVSTGPAAPSISRVIWKFPERWRSPSLPQRPTLYPALYLRHLGLNTSFRRNLAKRDYEEAEAFVMVTDGPLGDSDLDLLRRLGEHPRPLLFAPMAELSAPDARAVHEVKGVVVVQGDDGPLRSRLPDIGDLRSALVSGGGARLAEDLMLSAAFDLWKPNERGIPPYPGRYILVTVEDGAALAQVAPALRNHANTTEFGLYIVADNPSALVIDHLGLPSPVLVDSRSTHLLAMVANAAAVLCVYPSMPLASPVPGAWARTALLQGAPVIASSHASLDGLAHLCVLDDWERGLALYEHHPSRRLADTARAQTFLADGLRPSRVAEQWRGALESAQAGVAHKRSRHPSRRPVLLVLFDLAQDIDVLLPVVLALRERRLVHQKVAVTDWLETASPRTLSILAKSGIDFDLLPRGPIRKGELPSLDGIDGVLTASDTSAGPHRSGHMLGQRANKLGLCSFTMQHGLENIGLTYRDEATSDIRFASKTVFTWGPAEALPDWVPEKTRARAAPLGTPKRTPPPASALRLSDQVWRRTIGVFENLHWERFDDAYRTCFLDDLTQTAAEQPEVLFLVKPHHAGRWLIKNPHALPETANLKILDPSNPAWEPYTAPVLITSVDAVVTTPSTVALDAARAGRPIAVAGYGLDLPIYEPLPVLRSGEDWKTFLTDGSYAFIPRNETFLARVLLPGCANHRIAAHIEEALGRTSGGTRRVRDTVAYAG